MAVLLGFASALVYGVGDWCGGRAARRQASLLVAAVGQAVSLVIVAAVTLGSGIGAPGAATWWWSAGGGMVGALGIAGLYYGLANGEVSVVAPVTAVVGVIVPVAVGLATGERPTALALAGIAAAVVAIALVSGAVSRRDRATPLRIVVLAAAVGGCFGSLFVALDRADAASGTWPLLIARLASVPMLLVLIGVRRVRPAADRGSIGVAVLAGAFDMAANALYLEAVRQGMMSLVAAVSSLYPASTVALASVVDKEQITRSKAYGLAAAGAALVLVSLGRS
ncbi:MAG: EamA family transporter [Ilumatobacteraceae bacterium]